MKADLRAFLRELGSSGKLKKVTTPLNLLEIPQAMRQAEREGKAIIFENIEGFDYPLVNNILGGREFLALALAAAGKKSCRSLSGGAPTPWSLNS